MRLRAAFVAVSVGLALVLAGCSGGGGSASSSSSSSTSKSTSTSSSTTQDIRTITTTISGSVTTITSTVTQTTTSQPLPPGAPPDIANLTVAASANSATVTWDIAGGTGAVSSKAEYGYSSLSNFTSQTGSAAGRGPQSVTLTGLAACSDYKVRIAASDSAGTTVRTNAVPFTTTAGQTLAITGTAAPDASVTDVSFRVDWTIAGTPDAKSHVEYGTTGIYGSSTPDVVGTGTKSATVSGLSAGTDYNYRVVVTSPCGAAQTGNLIKRTSTVYHVDIKGNFANVNSFNKGSTVDGELKVAKDKPIVFDIKNLDSADHTWTIVGASPAYTSPAIKKDNTYHFPTSVILTGGKHTMRCTIHPSMEGTISAE